MMEIRYDNYIERAREVRMKAEESGIPETTLLQVMLFEELRQLRIAIYRSQDAAPMRGVGGCQNCSTPGCRGCGGGYMR